LARVKLQHCLAIFIYDVDAADLIQDIEEERLRVAHRFDDQLLEDSAGS